MITLAIALLAAFTIGALAGAIAVAATAAGAREDAYRHGLRAGLLMPSKGRTSDHETPFDR